MAKYSIHWLLLFFVFACQPAEHQTEGKDTIGSQRIAQLPDEINETSALVYHNGFLLTLNDSGGDPILYQIDTGSFHVTRKNHLIEVPNIDWEAMALNHQHAFIGDFGNNYGVRNDLCIYYICKSDLDKTQTNPQKISFTYANWEAPAKSLHSTRFDAEAMLAFEDTLWLFSKDWVEYKTTIYKIPAKAGTHVLTPWKTLEVDGLVTDACFGTSSGSIWLTGYKKYVPLLWKLHYVDSLQLIEVRKRWTINAPDSIQNEGLCFVGNELWFTSEKSKSLPAAIYKVVLPE